MEFDWDEELRRRSQRDELLKMSERELEEAIAKQRRVFETVGSKLNDGGSKIKANLKLFEAEMERRKLRRLEKEMTKSKKTGQELVTAVKGNAQPIAIILPSKKMRIKQTTINKTTELPGEKVQSPKKKDIKTKKETKKAEEKKASSPPPKQKTSMKLPIQNVPSPKKRTRIDKEDELIHIKVKKQTKLTIQEKQEEEEEEEEREVEEGEEVEKEEEDEEEQQQELHVEPKKSFRSKCRSGTKSPSPIQKKKPIQKRKLETKKDIGTKNVSKSKGQKRKSPCHPKKLKVKKQKKEKSLIQEVEEGREDEEVVVKPLKEGLQYRSTLVSLVKLVKEKTFSEVQKQEIKKSPFGNLLLPIIEKELDEAYVRKSDFDALKLVKQYQGWNGRFKLGSKSVRLTEKEITLIFGIQSGPIRIRLSTKPRKPNTRFADRVCSKDSRVMNISSLRLYFDQAMKRKKLEDAKDVARVLTLFVIATLFCPSTSSRLSWSYLEFVEDLEKSTSYAWSTFITEYLIDELNTKAPKNVGGCIVGLLYWMCEHAHLVNIAKPTHIPRFNKWRLCDLNEVLTQTPLESLDPEKVIDSELEPTDEEKELLQFVEVTTRELEKTDYEETRDEQAENEEIEPKDGNSEFQTEVEMLRNENKRLKEENDELWTTISILDNDNPSHQLVYENDTIADLGFEGETVDAKKHFMEREIDKRVVEIGSMPLENDIITEKLQEKDEEIVVLEDNVDDLGTHCITKKYQAQSEDVPFEAKLEAFMGKLNGDDNVDAQSPEFGAPTAWMRKTVGGHLLPKASADLLEKLVAKYGDFTTGVNCSRFSTLALSNLCAAVLDMSRTKFEDLNETQILKWKSAAIDAESLGFNVTFFTSYLQIVAKALFGRAARVATAPQLEKINTRIEVLKAEVEMLEGEKCSLLAKQSVGVEGECLSIAATFDGCRLSEQLLNL